MTSLSLTPKDGCFRSSVPEWGTNRMAEKVPLWSAKSPTWHLSGEPIEQFYELTQLKKSNVRLNDQLMPKPQESTLGDKMIQEPFPAEHPYASHVPRLKMFPSFATTAEEPKRGVAALQSQPLTSETPASNYDITIKYKTKGAGARHEVQSLPPESMKRGLTWHGEQGFHHTYKTPEGERQEFYPTPTSLVVPNLQARDGTPQAISDRTANATRNLERQQWKTTYERNHSGIGPSNQYKLDNLLDKQNHKSIFGAEDNEIYPWFTNTFEPARPQDGRIAAVQNPNYGVPMSMGAAQPDTGYVRKATLTEREEDRLLNGKEYVNLPEPQPGKDEQWKEWSSMHHPEDRFKALIERQMREAPNPLPYEERGTEPLEEKKETYMETLAEQTHDKIQQVEADNRWQDLEAYKPAHSLGVLKRKEQICTSKEEVGAFYGHEGKYNEERAGLYKTSYDPEKLSFKLNSDPSNLNIRNNSQSATNAIQYPSALNVEADVLRTGIRTDPRSVPMFSERPDIFETFEPFERDRFVRKQQLQPSITNARTRVQEGGVINRESTMASSYNTNKFLQENSMKPAARSEPLALMSHANHNLQNVRVNARKHVKFDEQVSVGEGAGNTPLLVTKTHIETPNQRAIPIPALKKTQANSNYLSMERSTTPFQPSSPSKIVPGADLFASKSSNLGMGATSFDTFKSSYARDSEYKPPPATDSLRYSWEPGCGTPRPQTSLLRIQDSFSKTGTYKSLRSSFPETNPNLIDNVNKGRKHNFGTLNAQVLRGALINA